MGDLTEPPSAISSVSGQLKETLSFLHYCYSVCVGHFEFTHLGVMLDLCIWQLHYYPHPVWTTTLFIHNVVCVCVCVCV